MQIQNQSGRDDTIDPYYLMQMMRRGSGTGGTNATYGIEKRVGSDGQIYYQLIEYSEGSSTAVGPNIQFAADELLYDDTHNIAYVLDNLIRRDSEIQEILIGLSNRAVTNVTTLDELSIDTTGMSLNDVVAAVAAEDLSLETLVVGKLDNSASPSGVDSVDVEIKTIQTDQGVYYELSVYSDTVPPYKWTALYKDSEQILDWTAAYDGGGDAASIENLQTALESHATNSDIHVTAEEKAQWNNHVNVSVDESQGKLIFTH